MEVGSYRLRKFELELQTVAGVRTDLRLVREMLAHCVETDSEVHDTCEELEEACWTTAIVRYARCFSQRPWRYVDVVESKLSETQFESHHYFRYLRDKMIGHAIGGLGEDFEVTAAVYPGPKGVLEVVGVGPRPRRIFSPGENLASEFLELVEVVSALLERHFEGERARVLALLRSVPVLSAVKGAPLMQSDIKLEKSDPKFRDFLAIARGRINPKVGKAEDIRSLHSRPVRGEDENSK